MINLNRCDLVNLWLFVAVVDGGSLTLGADRFKMSLAAASQRIGELEQHCGVTLLQRSQPGLTATPAGQTLHRHAIEVIAQLKRLAQAVDELQSGASGTCVSGPTARHRQLPADLLARYAQLHPQIRIDLEDALSEDGVRAVQKGVAELAVIGDNVPSEGLKTFVCNVDQLVLLVPKNHRLVSSPSIARSKAVKEEMIALARAAPLTRKLIAVAEAMGRSVRIRVQMRSFDRCAG